MDRIHRPFEEKVDVGSRLKRNTEVLSPQVVSLGITSFTLCCLGIARFHAATSSSQSNGRRVERCLSVLLKLLLVWLTAVTLASPEIFLWQLSQAVSPSTSHMVDSCIITPSSPLALYLPDSLHSLLLRYHQVGCLHPHKSIHVPIYISMHKSTVIVFALNAILTSRLNSTTDSTNPFSDSFHLSFRVACGGVLAATSAFLWSLLYSAKWLPAT